MSDNTQPTIRPADAAAISEAAQLLRAGGLVAVPTETVYGLAARADSDEAVARIYRAKGRPDFNPLIVHVGDVQQAERWAFFDDQAKALAATFWPGALTLVVPKRPEAPLASAVTAGLPTLALRCPAHPVMRQLISQAGLPLAAPSANRSGGVSPTCAEHVAASLGRNVDLILDGGDCAAGIESTIVALRSGATWQILRPGPVTRAQISDVLGAHNEVLTSPGGIEAPGQLERHYAPGKPLRLGAERVEIDEFHIGFGDVPGELCLSRRGDLAEAAAGLYAALHAAAASPKPRIAVAPIPDRGIGTAINDRLARAAA